MNNFATFINWAHKGTLKEMDLAVSERIEEVKSVAVLQEQVKHILAVHWLAKEKPAGFWNKIKFLFNVLKEIDE